MKDKNDNNTQPSTSLSPLKKAFVAIESLERQLSEKNQKETEAIAITGMSCRLPGSIENPQQFWQFLCRGGDGIVHAEHNKQDTSASNKAGTRWSVEQYVDPDRQAIGKTVTLDAGLIDDHDKFDARFFGISPREAQTMDPQQRLAMELCYSAAQDAGYNSKTLEGSDTGVYLGVGTAEYFNMCLQSDSDDAGFFVSGNALNVISGRVAYSMGLQGPSMAIDTACSSSLVAVHQAVQALRKGECKAALAGGVNLLLDPNIFVSLSKANMLSADGRCKVFDDTADGYVRGEGGAILVLKTLSQAQKDNDNIHAVICGSAVNQDGRSSSLTAPNGSAQQKVIRKALADAGLNAGAVSYVETHGTGTPLGDPIEVHALNAVYGQANSGKKLVLGALKSNIGHLESASGAASIVKAVLSLKNREIPPNINFSQQNKYFDITGSPIVFPVETQPWSPPEGGSLCAGVSSFGFSGTNCHIILGQAPQTMSDNTHVDKKSNEIRSYALPLSARTPLALKKMSENIANFLSDIEAPTDQDLARICYSMAVGRNQFPVRKVFIANTCSEMIDKLQNFSQLDEHNMTQASGKNPRIGFMFTGQGSQYVGMAETLYHQEPVFKGALDASAESLSDVLEYPLLDVLWGEHSEWLNQTAYTQPALFAVEYSLALLWQSWGIRPDVVMGHSVGEYAAACVAGVFSLNEGIRLIAERARLMQSLPADGSMMVIMADREFVESLVSSFTDQNSENINTVKISIAAYNTDSQVVISGHTKALDILKLQCEKQAVNCIELPVSHAFHSLLMQPIVSQFSNFIKSTTLNPANINLISNVSGQLENDILCTHTYWADHILAPVNFCEGVKTLSKQVDIVIEIGPRLTLTGMAKQCCPNSSIKWLGSLTRPGADMESMLSSVSEAYQLGCDIAWNKLWDSQHDDDKQRISLPLYPYQRKRFWVNSDNTDDSGKPVNQLMTPHRQTDATHPLIGLRLPLPMLSDHCYQSIFTESSPGYLEHHRLFGTVIVPGASHVSMALTALRDSFDAGFCELHSLAFFQTIAIPDGGDRTAQIILSPTTKITAVPDFAEGDFKIVSLLDESHPHQNQSWEINATGSYRYNMESATESPLTKAVETINIAEAIKVWTFEEKADVFYTRLWDRGYTLGSAFCWVGDRWREDDLTLHQINMPELPDNQAIYPLYPGLIDSCFQAFGSAIPLQTQNDEDIYIPFSIENVKFYRQPQTKEPLWCLSRSRSNTSSDRYIGDLVLFNEAGEIIVDIAGLELRKSSSTLLKDSLKGINKQQNNYYHSQWLPLQTPARPVEHSGLWLILTEDGFSGKNSHSCQYLVDYMDDLDIEWMVVSKAESFLSLTSNTAEMSFNNIDDYKQLFKLIKDNAYGHIDGIVNLLPLTDNTISEQQQILMLCEQMTNLVHASITELSDSLPALTIVTQGAQSVHAEAINTIQHAIWSLARVIRTEQVQLSCRCYDIYEPSQDSIKSLCNDIFSKSTEKELAIRNGKRFFHRVSHCPQFEQMDSMIHAADTISERSTYVLTGALGGVGFETVKWLIKKGARHLLLLVRRSPSKEQEQMINGYLDQGINITCSICDLTDAEKVSHRLDEINKTQYPVGGVLHLAGVMDNRFIEQQDKESYNKVFSSKISATANLDKATRLPSVQFFICFSSLSSILGTPGQANYAVANGFMDALMMQRRQQGYAGLSINWGPWADVGMAVRASKDDVNKMASIGINPFPVEQGLEAMLQLITKTTKSGLDNASTTLIYADLEWKRLLSKFPGAGVNSLLTDFSQQFSNDQLERGAYKVLLQEVPLSDRELLLGDQIQSITRNIMKLEENEDLGPNLGFFDSGMDSLMSLEFRQKLEAVYDITLPPTVVFNYPTMGELILYLRDVVLHELFIEENTMNTTNGIETTKSHNETMGRQAEVPLQEEQQAYETISDDVSEEDLEKMLEEQLTLMNEG